MRQSTRQAQAAAKKNRDKPKAGRALLRGMASLIFAGLSGFGSYQLLVHPQTPLPRAWNPVQSLRIDDPVTLLTGWKLNRAAANVDICLAALDDGASFQSLPDLETSSQCHIRDRVDLSVVGQTHLATFETRCAIALRLAMWEQHSLQPAAQDILGSALTDIDHFGSYNCRSIRTLGGSSTRMSTHATADAIDVAGFTFADGRSVRLIEGWDGPSDEAAFLRAARDGACKWFSLTLSPDYNALHADHFHLQSTGWGLCK